jgi:hypothetical protein
VKGRQRLGPTFRIEVTYSPQVRLATFSGLVDELDKELELGPSLAGLWMGISKRETMPSHHAHIAILMGPPALQAALFPLLVHLAPPLPLNHSKGWLAADTIHNCPLIPGLPQLQHCVIFAEILRPPATPQELWLKN